MKRTVLCLLFVHLTLSIYMMAGMGAHLLKHGQTTNHAMQHASFVCSWMCAASSFVDASGPQLDPCPRPGFELLTFIGKSDYALSTCSLYIRGPPPASFL